MATSTDIEGPGTAERVGGDEGSRQGTHGAGGAAGSELRARGAAAAVAVVVGTASKCHPASSLGHP